MSVYARKFAATPIRTASETWAAISELISKENSAARTELVSVTGIASCLIADETPKDNPIIVFGNGPRLRIYCLYGEDAVVGDDKDESDLSWNPTEGDWKMRLPCGSEDLEWVQKALGQSSSRITAYDPAAEEEEPENKSSSATAQKLTINTEVFKSK
jgi:hypothetical protein